MSTAKRWVIAVEGEAMTEEEARKEAQSMAKKQGWNLYLAEIKEKIVPEGKAEK